MQILWLFVTNKRFSEASTNLGDFCNSFGWRHHILVICGELNASMFREQNWSVFDPISSRYHDKWPHQLSFLLFCMVNSVVLITMHHTISNSILLSDFIKKENCQKLHRYMGFKFEQKQVSKINLSHYHVKWPHLLTAVISSTLYGRPWVDLVYKYTSHYLQFMFANWFH